MTAHTSEENQNKLEIRTLISRAASAESLGFPFAAQVARVRRQREGRQDEEVGLITDWEPAEWSAAQWLDANWAGWGIENGRHQRLDVTLNDDRCRVRHGNGQLVLGLFRRQVISLFMHWRQRQPTPHEKSLTEFQTVMGENNLAKAMSFLTATRPKPA